MAQRGADAAQGHTGHLGQLSNPEPMLLPLPRLPRLPLLTIPVLVQRIGRPALHPPLPLHTNPVPQETLRRKRGTVPGCGTSDELQHQLSVYVTFFLSAYVRGQGIV